MRLIIVLAFGVVTPPVAGQDRPDLYVLCVGVEATAIKKGKPDIYGRDAKLVAQAFDAAKPAFRTVHKKVVTGEDADRDGAIAGLEWMKKKMGSDDVGFVFFSTHGDMDDKQGFYSLTANSGGGNWRKKVLWGTDIADAVGEFPGRVIVALDVCCSGGLLQVPGNKLARASVLCACRATECSYGGRRGYYARALCEGLAGKADGNGDGAVTVAELSAYAGGRADKLSENAQHHVVKLVDAQKKLVLARP